MSATVHPFDRDARVGRESPPHNIEAEQALLGAILVNNKCFDRVSDFLEPKHFFEPIHQRIFEIVGEYIRAGRLAIPTTLKNTPADIDFDELSGTLKNALPANFPERRGFKYLGYLMSCAATAITAKEYGTIVYDFAMRRQVVAICQETIENAKHKPIESDPHEQIDACTTKLRLLAEEGYRLSRQPKWIDMSNWDNEPVPDRQWAIRDRVPVNQAGLFSGEGGTGKSIIELMKDVAHVTGKDWFGSLPEPGPAFYLGAEDDENEIHIRLAAIIKHYGVTFKELIDGGLHIRCLLGEDATLCAVVNGKSGTVEVTKLYRQTYEQAGDIKPKNISIDTLSRAFAGNEIDRVQVYAFANHMQALARVAGGSVTVLSHPSLAGIASGSGISGSTAWHGAFRFRQYLKGVKSTDEESDADLRELQFKKNQYGPLGETVVVRYQNGLFLPERGKSSLEKAAHEAESDRLFIVLLKRFSAAGRNVSHSTSSPNYAPKVFAEEAEAKAAHLHRADLKEAMQRLFAGEKIVVETYGKPSNPHQRIGVKNA
jgi:RecA-family ATPase